MGDLRCHGAPDLTDSPVVVLGATGSIGTAALEVADRLGFTVVGVAARRWSPGLLDLAARYPEARMVTVDPVGSDEVPAGVRSRLGHGDEDVDALAATPGAVVVNGVVGCAGLRPSLSALDRRQPARPGQQGDTRGRR